MTILPFLGFCDGYQINQLQHGTSSFQAHVYNLQVSTLEFRNQWKNKSLACFLKKGQKFEFKEQGMWQSIKSVRK